MFKQVSVSPTTLPRLPKAGLKEATPATVSGLSWEAVKDQYTILEPLDDHGTVVHAKDAEGKSWAIKRVDPINQLECRFMYEVYLKTKLAPLLKECGEDYIVMELISGATLARWVKQVSSTQILRDSLRTLLDLVSAFDELGVVHGDLHGNNVIVTKDGWRVIDFEHAHRGRESENESFCYAALDIIAQIKKIEPEAAGIKFECTFDGLEEYLEKLDQVLVPAIAEDTSELLRKLFI